MKLTLEAWRDVPKDTDWEPKKGDKYVTSGGPTVYEIVDIRDTVVLTKPVGTTEEPTGWGRSDFTKPSFGPERWLWLGKPQAQAPPPAVAVPVFQYRCDDVGERDENGKFAKIVLDGGDALIVHHIDLGLLARSYARNWPSDR